jgi:acetyl-CoA carboxylase biotin carboxylase subunit
VRFLPSPGTLRIFRAPTGPDLRIETGYAEGQEVTTFYDPLLAKVISWGPDRRAARQSVVAALRGFEIEGVSSNIPALINVLESPEFRTGSVHTEVMSAVLARTGKEPAIDET